MTLNYILEPGVKFDCKQGHGQADTGDKWSSSKLCYLVEILFYL